MVSYCQVVHTDEVVVEEPSSVVAVTGTRAEAAVAASAVVDVNSVGERHMNLSMTLD